MKFRTVGPKWTPCARYDRFRCTHAGVVLIFVIQATSCLIQDLGQSIRKSLSLFTIYCKAVPEVRLDSQFSCDFCTVWIHRVGCWSRFRLAKPKVPCEVQLPNNYWVQSWLCTLLNISQTKSFCGSQRARCSLLLSGIQKHKNLIIPEFISVFARALQVLKCWNGYNQLMNQSGNLQLFPTHFKAIHFLKTRLIDQILCISLTDLKEGLNKAIVTEFMIII